jgi:hypothetical protein
VKSVHIQQTKLEEDEGLVGENLSGEVVAEQQFSDEGPTEVRTTTQSKTNTTKGEYVLGNRCDSPLIRRECNELVCNRRTNQWSSWMRLLRR